MKNSLFLQQVKLERIRQQDNYRKFLAVFLNSSGKTTEQIREEISNIGVERNKNRNKELFFISTYGIDCDIKYIVSKLMHENKIDELFFLLDNTIESPNYKGRIHTNVFTSILINGITKKYKISDIFDKLLDRGYLKKEDFFEEKAWKDLFYNRFNRQIEKHTLYDFMTPFESGSKYFLKYLENKGWVSFEDYYNEFKGLANNFLCDSNRVKIILDKLYKENKDINFYLNSIANDSCFDFLDEKIKQQKTEGKKNVLKFKSLKKDGDDFHFQRVSISLVNKLCDLAKRNNLSIDWSIETTELLECLVENKKDNKYEVFQDLAAKKYSCSYMIEHLEFVEFILSNELNIQNLAIKEKNTLYKNIASIYSIYIINSEHELLNNDNAHLRQRKLKDNEEYVKRLGESLNEFILNINNNENSDFIKNIYIKGLEFVLEEKQDYPYRLKKVSRLFHLFEVLKPYENLLKEDDKKNIIKESSRLIFSNLVHIFNVDPLAIYLGKIYLNFGNKGNTFESFKNKYFDEFDENDMLEKLNKFVSLFEQEILKNKIKSDAGEKKIRL